MSRAAQLLGPEGPLAAAIDSYEARPGQLSMAEAVERALAEEHILFCEAGTGTGKSLAYLVPAALSGRRIVVSTATRALQDQIVDKDVPLVERVIGRPLRVTVLKGLSNYLCQRRYGELLASSESTNPRNATRLSVLQAWQAQSTSGDLAELSSIPEGDPLLDAVRSSSDTRIGSRCKHYETCFVTRVKQQAQDAEIVITNHHLFFADLALRGPHPGRVLPNYDAVIFDEAHQLEDVATLFFGVRVSQKRIDTLLADVNRLLGARANGFALGRNIAEQAAETQQRLFDELSRGAKDEPRLPLPREAWVGTPHDCYLELDTALESVETTAELARDAESNGEVTAEAWESVLRRVQALRQALAVIVDGSPGRVNWLDNAKGGRALSSTAVDLAETLRDRLFDRVASVVLTSATLTTAPTKLDEQGDASPFAFARSRLGAVSTESEVRELTVDSPFDFERRALLYLPKDLPAPNAPDFAQAMAERAQHLIDASDGGAFVLTTSIRAMRSLHRLLSASNQGRPVLVQGQAPKQSLLATFRTQPHCVLVATLSFWEGVDVPGEALRLVVLEKVPFSVPSDPVLQARAAALQEAGRNAFTELFLPLAQMTLKQGFGRLIRTTRDRGVVALMDCRVHQRGYGQRLLKQLPPARRTTDLDETLAFLKQADE